MKMLYFEPNSSCSMIIYCTRKYLQPLSLIAILAILISTNSFAQIKSNSTSGPFQLSGTLYGRDTGKIVLWYPDTSGKWIRDTAYLKNGTFAFQGYINEPSYAHLIGSKKDGNYASFYLAGGAQFIKLEENKFERLQMNGSATQKENEKLYEKLNLVRSEIENLSIRKQLADSLAKLNIFDSVRKKLEEQKLEKISMQIDELHDSILKTRAEFIRLHPNSYVSPTELLGLLIVNSYPIHPAKALYDSLSNEIKYSRAGKLCYEEIKRKLNLTQGSILPNFEGFDVNNKSFSLSAFRGKFVLLEFWASWCVPCRKAIPEIKNVYKKYHHKGFEIVAISIDRDNNAWKKAIENDAITSWTHLLRSEKMVDFLSISEIPQSILLDRSGKIIWSSLDKLSDSWQERLQVEIDSK